MQIPKLQRLTLADLRIEYNASEAEDSGCGWVLYDQDGDCLGGYETGEEALDEAKLAVESFNSDAYDEWMETLRYSINDAVSHADETVLLMLAEIL